ncbi:MAG: site-specific DNA-methyltransferase [Bacteroidetes bacterium]|nr:MAG: site-specific DNA-methyltransferase [Bacteroidota bacterium]
MAINKLILGDCLEVLKTLENETVDLIYIDPPFFSNRTYEVIWGDKGEIRSFEDRFSGGIDHYIGWLKDRIQEMYRILKPTGSIFVHCDYHANAEIKVFVLNKIFGSNNFRNEITWKRNFTKKGSQFKMSKLAQNTDTIFYYVKNDKAYFSTPRINGSMEELLLRYDKEDEDSRRFKSEPIELPRMMARENLIYEYKNYTPKYGWMMVREKLEEIDKQGKLYFTKNGKPRRKSFLDEYGGSEADNIWLDITPVGQNQSEIIGYPTQKPEALLERIIKMASNENDVILDCFVGGGTTITVADKLNRNWIGIDQSVQAVKVTEFRLNKQQNLFSKPFTVQLHKYDYDTLRYKDAFEFETWIVGQFGGLANSKQRGDLGLDGKTRENQPIQVKRSDGIGRNVIDNFFSAVQRFDKASFEKNKSEQKPIGFIIAFSFGKGAIQEVARLKNQENVIIKLVTVEDIVPIAKKPTLQVEMQDLGKIKELRQISFVATGQSEAGIEFFAWDFAYNEPNFVPEILLDKTGKQTYLFKAGEHKIAVKVVDNEGLENIEVIKLKVNGEVKRN